MEFLGAGAGSLVTERWFLLLFSTIFIIFPLTLLSRINSLRYRTTHLWLAQACWNLFHLNSPPPFVLSIRHTSILGFLATAYLLVAVIAETSRSISEDGRWPLICSLELT